MPTALQVSSAEELGLPQLLRLALKQLALDIAGEVGGRRVWLDEQPARLHAKIKQLQVALGDRLPTLQNIHFLDRGPFPYSGDVAVALEVLQQSGAINRENPNYTRFSPRVFSDTRTAITPEINRLFPVGSAEREAFDAFVQGLKELATDE